MITIFNRASVYMGTDMQRFAHVREVLSRNNIRYTIKITNPLNKRTGLGEARIPMGGIRTPDTYEVFVHKRDHELAVHALREK